METDRLADLMERRREILSGIHELSRRQSDLIQQGDTNRLLSLLAAKQAAIGRLRDIEGKLDPFRGQEPDARQWRSTQRRQQARRAASDSEALLKEIIRVEQECEQHLRRRRDAAAARLQGVHDATRARTAYLGGDTPPNSQLDLSSET